MQEFIHRELSKDIIGAAAKVLSTLKPGLDEKLYEKALLIELVKRGHRVDSQKSFPVHHEGHFLGTLIPDLVVDDLVIVDPKVVDCFNSDHIAQMLGYLAITGLELALLLNFRRAKLECKRVINKPLTNNEFSL
jgi:GxxExxY protein